ncbi:bifunctional helix-turn-helix transcriptional regulator/GNAT family N-acetyltransferase [Solirubrobacter phytolaccae]|uniref:Bifunctional helix-turn-helix transcriptional regulator/GNAT family N-acetyltransferase n=1 Tax=Solirubrobacter phytolaccae TaxID=1404360 RepID=A0A9X3N3A2_9ACTN|nr:bifunctional helix-turn-helix transcriptional regulator/GNAT family N-acetyltransferase [Solirubrobacter phytolaccae]MDA0178928.1 bifunctional helix-turn-helix transcriptional regulator/GNAT family N-acetyltransferase [Solirubrobacter phytolaccae]
MEEVERVRSFNRTVTERVGALMDSYLDFGRPLGASRVLWEVGAATDVRDLRARLSLDSGYLSRLLRTLEGEGLVTVEAGTGDRRRRTVALTAAGRAERARLDARSDDLARSFLAPLSERQTRQLVDAMATVERLLTAGIVELTAEDPAGDAARHCLSRYFAEIDERFDGGFREAVALPFDSGVFVVARLRGEPIGCGALKDVTPPEIKRMWVAPEARGLGVGRRILAELERHAVEAGTATIRLETNRVLAEAQQLYRSAGYVEVEPFNAEPYAHYWFTKTLKPGTSTNPSRS